MKRMLLAIIVLIYVPFAAQAQTVTPDEARAIAKEATIYGFPLVDNYRIQYSYFVDRSSPEFKESWNKIVNNARVYTPDDKAIQTPNSDTPYSYVGGLSDCQRAGGGPRDPGHLDASFGFLALGAGRGA
jgi:hypothetical protein